MFRHEGTPVPENSPDFVKLGLGEQSDERVERHLADLKGEQPVRKPETLASATSAKTCSVGR